MPAEPPDGGRVWMLATQLTNLNMSAVLSFSSTVHRHSYVYGVELFTLAVHTLTC